MAAENIIIATSDKQLSVPGKSGKKYLFKIYPIDERFELTDGAVYCIFKRENPKKFAFKFLYIGRAKFLAKRFYDHHKERCFKRHKASHIGVHVCDVETERKEIEADLLAVHTCPCNEVLN